jgi:hypothetical protein
MKDKLLDRMKELNTMHSNTQNSMKLAADEFNRLTALEKMILGAKEEVTSMINMCNDESEEKAEKEEKGKKGVKKNG